MANVGDVKRGRTARNSIEIDKCIPDLSVCWSMARRGRAVPMFSADGVPARGMLHRSRVATKRFLSCWSIPALAAGVLGGPVDWPLARNGKAHGGPSRRERVVELGKLVGRPLPRSRSSSGWKVGLQNSRFVLRALPTTTSKMQQRLALTVLSTQILREASCRVVSRR